MSKTAPKIKDVTQLRDHALLTLEKLADGTIDTAEAGVTSKLCESVITTIKAQLEYSRMLGENIQIPFLLESHHVIENGKTINGKVENKALPAPSRK
jgi:hypothetical protein